MNRKASKCEAQWQLTSREVPRKGCEAPTSGPVLFSTIPKFLNRSVLINGNVMKEMEVIATVLLQGKFGVEDEEQWKAMDDRGG